MESPEPTSPEPESAESAPSQRPLPWWRWVTDKLLLVAVATAVVLGVAIVFFENALIFFPSRYPEGAWGKKPGFAPQDVAFRAADDVELHGWWVPAKQQPSAGAVLYFHGNAGNLSDRDWLCMLLAEAGLDVFIVDYRGYGRSADVAPTEQGLYDDARGAWRTLTGELGIAPERVVILGQSLGGAPATQLATEVDAAGLVLVCAFTSIPDMARQIVPIPLGWALSNRMDNRAKLPGVTLPTLVVHATRDEVIPFAHGQRNFAASGGQPKAFLEVPDAGHNEVWHVGGAPLLRAVRDFVEDSTAD